MPEALAGCGFDWIVIDTEHSAVEAVEVLPALQAMAAWPDVAPVVRPAFNDLVLIKRILDFGAQTRFYPMSSPAEEARAAVRAVRYPRSSRRCRDDPRQPLRCDRRLYGECEHRECARSSRSTRAALDALEDIAMVEGSIASSLARPTFTRKPGAPRQPGAREVVTAIEGAISRLGRSGAAIGHPDALDEGFARRCMALGTTFTAIGVDLATLVDGMKALRARFLTHAGRQSMRAILVMPDNNALCAVRDGTLQMPAPLGAAAGQLFSDPRAERQACMRETPPRCAPRRSRNSPSGNSDGVRADRQRTGGPARPETRLSRNRSFSAALSSLRARQPSRPAVARRPEDLEIGRGQRTTSASRRRRNVWRRRTTWAS